MYLRAAHAELNIPALRHFIKQNPLGLFVTAVASPNFPTIQCTHLPWLIDVQDETSETELGTLRGHMARANPHAKALIEAVTAAAAGPRKSNSDSSVSDDRDGCLLTDEVSIMFTGPAHHYVTPKFYVETKPSTGKVVPTWNYSAVQVYGKARIYCDSGRRGGDGGGGGGGSGTVGDDDPKTSTATTTTTTTTSSFLQKQISDLSDHAETNFVMGNATTTTGRKNKPWSVDDAPERYVEILKKNIIGIEVQITRLEGKYKMSQELVEGDREGVIKGFEAMGTDEALTIARTVEERGRLKDDKAQAAKANAAA
ncbi:hypothetical protein PV08_04219 [Exophiala spinifera]|uniref:Transcriptional regulator n=1 Tax=Exophiala spinifera TaxID=91928 RepID=A0A0D2BDM8_9EURO|nr:uncharacterized protein PV08_04219 [Exophiala spinifera]KIW17028.1 hypothetical protein PV08_04219 [Exophiala spinifera]